MTPKSKSARFHRMLRLVEDALVRLTAFLIFLIFLVQLVWAHVAQIQPQKPPPIGQAPLVQQIERDHSR